MDQVDMDLMKVTGEYLMSIENQKVLIDSLPRVQSILKQLEDPRNNTKSGKISKQTGKAASKKNAKNNRLEQVRSLIDREYYGVQLSQSANQYVFLTKLMSNFSKLASFSSLALNIPADLKNRYGQLAQNIIEGAGGEFVNLKDLANARAWAFQTMIKWAATDIYAKGVPSLTAQIIENFDAVFKTEDQLGQSVSRSLYRDLMNGSWATDFRKSAEMEAALQLFGGFMKHQKIEQRTTNGEVIYLDYLNLLDFGIVTCLDNNYGHQSFNTFSYEKRVMDYTKEYGDKINLLNNQKIITKNKLPLNFDTDDFAKGSRPHDYNPEIYNNCLINLVTETWYHKIWSNNYHNFLSEKTWKPIIAKQIFIIIGPQYTLKYLQQLGFKTFSEYLDESYDSLDDNKRLFAAIDSLNSAIKQYSLKELNDLTKHIREYNLDLFKSGIPELQPNFQSLFL
jgi:hypothetical protein